MTQDKVFGSKVSVVIPTADRGELLNRAIRSVLDQTVSPEKIIVVDNGENDAEIRSEFTACIHLIRVRPRIGPARARNIGAGTVRSAYVAFLDDDDFWEPFFLEHALDSFNSDQADAVVGQLKKARKNQKATPYKMFPADARKQRAVYYKNPGFGGQNIVLRTKLFHDIGGFDELLPPSEDRDLAARILQAGRRIISQPLAVAVLWDHDNLRARNNVLQGNKMFLRKHWKKMTPIEFIKAVIRYYCKYREIKGHQR